MKKLDLHGTRHRDVPREVIRFIEDNWACDTRLEIIIGHSKGMYEIVSKVLDEYKLTYSLGHPFDWDTTRIIIWPENENSLVI